MCLDMDMSLVDVAITDVRMLMARKGLEGKKWGWTDGGWGGDWLNLQNDRGQNIYYHVHTTPLKFNPTKIGC